MAGGHIEILVADMRGDYLLVTILFLNLAEKLLEAVAEGCAFGEPEGETGAYVLGEGEKLHLLAEFAVVAFLGFLREHEIFVEHLFLGEGDAVDSDELVALLVATPVGPCERGHFHGLDGGCRGDMRATAEVGERSLGVGGDIAVLKFADKLTLILLATVAEELQGVGL